MPRNDRHNRIDRTLGYAVQAPRRFLLRAGLIAIGAWLAALAAGHWISRASSATASRTGPRPLRSRRRRQRGAPRRPLRFRCQSTVDRRSSKARSSRPPLPRQVSATVFGSPKANTAGEGDCRAQAWPAISGQRLCPYTVAWLPVSVRDTRCRSWPATVIMQRDASGAAGLDERARSTPCPPRLPRSPTAVRQFPPIAARPVDKNWPSIRSAPMASDSKLPDSLATPARRQSHQRGDFFSQAIHTCSAGQMRELGFDPPGRRSPVAGHCADARRDAPAESFRRAGAADRSQRWPGHGKRELPAPCDHVHERDDFNLLLSTSIRPAATPTRAAAWPTALVDGTKYHTVAYVARAAGRAALTPPPRRIAGNARRDSRRPGETAFAMTSWTARSVAQSPRQRPRLVAALALIDSRARFRAYASPQRRHPLLGRGTTRS
jgi:hypothetical protein